MATPTDGPVSLESGDHLTREQLPGLRLHVPSMPAGDLAAVLAALRAPDASSLP
jgi:hypothetical protein